MTESPDLPTGQVPKDSALYEEMHAGRQAAAAEHNDWETDGGAVRDDGTNEVVDGGPVDK